MGELPRFWNNATWIWFDNVLNDHREKWMDSPNWNCIHICFNVAMVEFGYNQMEILGFRSLI